MPAHLMPVEQGLPWHPVAPGLAGQAIPFVVAASHAHALPSPPFWFPVPAVLVASPALLRPSSLSAVLAFVPPGVAPAFCVSVLLLPLSVGAPLVPLSHTHSCPTRLPPRTRVSHLRTTWTVPCAVGWSWPCCHSRGGHLPARGAQPPPLWSTWVPCRGRGGGGGGAGGAACRSLPPIVAVGLSHFQSPPLRPNTGQVLLQEAKVRKHGVAVFGQAHVTAWHVPQNTCCRHKPTLPLKT